MMPVEGLKKETRAEGGIGLLATATLRVPVIRGRAGLHLVPPPHADASPSVKAEEGSVGLLILPQQGCFQVLEDRDERPQAVQAGKTNLQGTPAEEALCAKPAVIPAHILHVCHILAHVQHPAPGHVTRPQGLPSQARPGDPLNPKQHEAAVDPIYPHVWWHWVPLPWVNSLTCPSSSSSPLLHEALEET